MNREKHPPEDRARASSTSIEPKVRLATPARYRFWIFITLIPVIFIVVVRVLLVVSSSNVTEAGDRSTKKDPTPQVQCVRVQEVCNNTSAAESAYTGVIRARYETDLAFRVSGKIVSRHVELGDRVKAGQLLFSLDPEDFELTLQATEAELESLEAEVVFATAEHARQQQLHGRNGTSTAAVDKARADQDVSVGRRDRATRMLAIARNRLSYCTLKAELDGVITFLPGEAGLVIREGQPVARLARDGGQEAVVSLPENRIDLARSATANVTLWFDHAISIPAELREVSPVADPLTRTYQARFSLLAADPQVELGMTATVHLVPTDVTPGFELPLSSLHRQSDRPAVWVVDRETGRPNLKTVEIREYRQESVLVHTGLQTGDLVVTAGVQKIDSGMLVRPWERN